MGGSDGPLMMSTCPNCVSQVRHEIHLREVTCEDCGTRFPTVLDEIPEDEPEVPQVGLPEEPAAPPPAAAAAKPAAPKAPPPAEVPQAPAVDASPEPEEGNFQPDFSAFEQPVEALPDLSAPPDSGDSLMSLPEPDSGDSLMNLPEADSGDSLMNLPEPDSGDSGMSVPEAESGDSLLSLPEEAGGLDDFAEAPAGEAFEVPETRPELGAEPSLGPLGEMTADSAEPEPALEGVSGYQEAAAAFEEIRQFGENLGTTPEAPESDSTGPAAAANSQPAPVAAGAGLVTSGDLLSGYRIDAYLEPVSVVTPFNPEVPNPLGPAFSALLKQAQQRGGNGVLAVRWSVVPDGSRVLLSGTAVRCTKSQ